MKRALALLLILAAACAAPKPNPQAAPLKIGEYDPESGPEPVGVIPTALLRDTARNKDIDIAVSYPTRGGPFPVIIFSHGYGNTPQNYEPLTSYWTRNGYVVIRPAHTDSGALRELMRDTLREAFQQPPETDSGRRDPRFPPPPQPKAQTEPQPFKPNPMETIWEKEREPQWRDRVADIRFVIDSLPDLETRFPELQGKMDRNRIGVSGHSYGAFTTMLIGGARTFSNPPLQLEDRRVKAAVVMSPQGPSQIRGLTEQSWAEVRIPMMFMAGTEERGVTEAEDAEWRRRAFELSPAGDKFFVLLKGGRASSYTASTAGAFDVVRPMNDPMVGTTNVSRGTTAPSREFYSGRNLFQKIKITSLVFWDAYLKRDAKAQELLQPTKLSSVAPGVELIRK